MFCWVLNMPLIFCFSMPNFHKNSWYICIHISAEKFETNICKVFLRGNLLCRKMDGLTSSMSLFFYVFLHLRLIRFCTDFAQLIFSRIFHRIWKCCTDDKCWKSFFHILFNNHCSFNGTFIGEMWGYHDQYQ